MNKNIWIIIPSYNKHNFLESAINSVIDQTFQNRDLFVVNDYADKLDSEEKRNEIINIIKDKDDSRIHLIHNDNNVWISKSRNVAIRECIRKDLQYTFFLDHDDRRIDIDKLKNQISILEKGEIWIIWSQFNIVNEFDDIIWRSANPLWYADILKWTLLSCPILMSTMGVNTDIFLKYGLLDERYNWADDTEFLVRNLKRCPAENISDKTTNYRYFVDNTSLTEWHRLIEEYIKIIKESGKDYNGYYLSLLIAKLKILVPSQYRWPMRRLKRFLLPSYNGFILDDVSVRKNQKK